MANVGTLFVKKQYLTTDDGVLQKTYGTNHGRVYINKTMTVLI